MMGLRLLAVLFARIGLLVLLAVTTAVTLHAQEQAAPAAAPAGNAGAAPSDTAAGQPQVAPAVDAALKQLDAADRQIATLEAKAEENAENDTELVKLKVEADELGRSMLEIGIGLRPLLTDVRSRLDTLGAPPGEGEPAEPEETASERAALVKQRATVNQLTGRAESIAIRASQLGDRITETRRNLFTNTLFKRTQIDAQFFAEARDAFAAEWSTFWQTMGSAGSFVLKYKLRPLLASVFLSLVAALFFVAGGYRIFGRLMYRDPDVEDPPYLHRLSAALWSTIVPNVALLALFVSILGLMINFAILRSDILPMFGALLGALLALSFVTRTARAVFAPYMPNWRLVAISNGGARTLYVLVVLMTVVNLADYVLGTISQTLGSPVVLTVAKSFFATVIVGVVLIAMSRVRPMRAKSGRLEDKGEPWPRAIAFSVAATGVCLVLMSIMGFVGLSRFISTQIVITGAIVATMYIGFLAGQAASHSGDFAQTSLGRYIDRRWSPGSVALDQIGLAFGLAGHVLVLLIGLPLIFLQWGFQIQDIELWIYRILTDIRIGGISISLTGIFIGILLFIFGLILTRLFQKWLDGTVMARGRVDAGVRNSIRTGVGYLGIALAGLFGVIAAGINLSSLALIAGGLSLGIGFGLQNIVSNFVSGLILLAERPFKVGDWVVTGSAEGFVKKISVRATEIETFQRQTVIVPNSELINASVANWTHRNAIGRADVAVGVAYDADPKKVLKLLEEIALDHELVLRNPPPAVHFVNFGESSLDFELKVFLADVLSGMAVKNDLRVAIYERFKAEGIEIPFPQRDLNFKLEDVPEALRERQKAAKRPAKIGAKAAQPTPEPERKAAVRRRKAQFVPDEDANDE